jgi:ABC-type amino acid transport substrate-binding protein
VLSLSKTTLRLLTLIIFSLSFIPAYGDDNDLLVVTFRAGASENDTRQNYYKDILTLTLEKTKAHYGNYKILEAPYVNQLRDAYAIDREIYFNYVVDENFEDKFLNTSIDYIPFPLDLGLTGMRICFVNPKVGQAIQHITTIDELKKYTIGQGIGWADVEILRQNGFKVVTVQNYDGIFKMTAIGRVDLFCRGVNELPREYETFKNINNLTYDESFAIIYRLPRFFLMNKKNVALKKRIEEGLQIAYKDGSLQNTFQKYHASSIQFSNLKQRKIFRIENPLIKKLPRDYEQYLYKLE